MQPQTLDEQDERAEAQRQVERHASYATRIGAAHAVFRQCVVPGGFERIAAQARIEAMYQPRGQGRLFRLRHPAAAS